MKKSASKVIEKDPNQRSLASFFGGGKSEAPPPKKLRAEEGEEGQKVATPATTAAASSSPAPIEAGDVDMQSTSAVGGEKRGRSEVSVGDAADACKFRVRTPALTDESSGTVFPCVCPHSSCHLSLPQ